ncbi:hypothetical protein diail_5413 [Diaporthe ilicicola]|nr:hypothetical protein diail_5413 [Diaporthe ilicicola]
MSYKPHDQGLAPGLVEAREKEVMDEIDKLIDKKLYFALARIIPSDPNATHIVDDPEIQEQAKNLKTAVAAVVERHESIISTIAKSKKDKDNDKPTSTCKEDQLPAFDHSASRSRTFNQRLQTSTRMGSREIESFYLCSEEQRDKASRARSMFVILSVHNAGLRRPTRNETVLTSSHDVAMMVALVAVWRMMVLRVPGPQNQFSSEADGLE